MAGSMATQLWFSGDKPKVPEYPMVDISAEQLAAIGGNLAALPGSMKLGSKINAYNIDEILKGLEKMLPGYAGLRDKGTALIESGLRGEVPDDVSNEIRRLSAETSRAGGYAGSEMARNLTARDLGLTSYAISQKALSSAQQWMQQARSATPIFDVTSMFVSPAQRIQVKLHENQMKFQHDWLKAQIDAMPSNVDRALGALFDNIEQSGQAALGAYAGGAMGGGGGGGGMSAGMGGGGGAAPSGGGSSRSYLDYSGTYPMDSGVTSYDLPSYGEYPTLQPLL